MSCCKTKILYQSNLSCECVPFINQRTLTPFPTGKAVQERSPSSGSHGVVGLSRFFCDCSAGVRPRFFRYSLFLSTGISTGFYKFRHSTFFNKFWQISTTTKSPNFRQNTHPQNMPNSDKFRQFDFSISSDQFRQTLFFWPHTIIICRLFKKYTFF